MAMILHLAMDWIGGFSRLLRKYYDWLHTGI